MAEELQRWDSEKDELVEAGVVPEDGFTLVASGGDIFDHLGIFSRINC